MLILTNWSMQGCLTSVTTPPRSYSEKAEVSPMLKEYWPGDRGDKRHTGSETKTNSHPNYQILLGCYLERLQMGWSVAHNYTVCRKSRQLGKETK